MMRDLRLGTATDVERPTVASAAALWVAVAVPLAIALALALGGPLGRLLQPEPLDFFDHTREFGLYRPETSEFARFAVLAGLATALALCVALLGRRPLPSALATPAAIARQVVPWVVLAGLAVAWISRREPDAIPSDPTNYFSGPELGLALALAAAAALIATSQRARDRIGALAALPRARGLAWAIAAIATALLLLPALFSGKSLPGAPPFVSVHLPYYLSDYAAVSNGLTPMVDHANYYAHLLPFALAPLLELRDYRPADFTALMTALSAATLLLLFRTLVLVVRSEVAGLALYLPVLGLALMPVIESANGIVFNANVYSILPERYLGPAILAWLCARHLRGEAPRRAWLVFLAAGLAALNNPELGVPALLATVAACAVAASSPPAERDGRWRRFGLELLAGLAASVALVCVLTLVRTGAIPDPAILLYFSRLFGLQGFGMLPAPEVGLWWALFAAFAGALLVAAIRFAHRDPDITLTGMLVFAGLLGLAGGTYYVGRSDKFTLTALFPVWGFSLALLMWHVVRSRLAGGRPQSIVALGPLGAAILIALGLGLTRFAGPPVPWGEGERLTTAAEGFTAFDLAEAAAFVAERTEPGEPVAVLRENSDLIARGAGARNVSPLSSPFFVAASQQLDFVLERLEEEGGRSVFTGDTPYLPLWREIPQELRARGYSPIDRSRRGGLTQWERPASPPDTP